MARRVMTAAQVEYDNPATLAHADSYGKHLGSRESHTKRRIRQTRSESELSRGDQTRHPR